MKNVLAVAAAVLALGSLAACSSNDDADPIVVTSTVKASTSKSETPHSSTADPTGVSAGSGETSDTKADPAASSQDSDSGCLVGSFGQPQFQGTQCMNKQIASCAPANGSYETGTTFFTDGTSGWTQVCGEQMAAQFVPPSPGKSASEDFAGSFESATPSPTFDPDSADGYGPNQELPPFCDRFPSDESC